MSDERWADAAAARDALAELRRTDPVLSNRAALQAAVQAERWAEAAAARDALARLRPPPTPVWSAAVTEDVTIAVRSHYESGQSDEAAGQHIFSYTVVFTNGGSKVVTLRSRHWVITDQSGKTEAVRGPGVVGQQPRLEPGASFTYASFCALRTRSGTMHGAMTFERADGSTFDAAVARFGLDVAGRDVEAPHDGVAGA